MTEITFRPYAPADRDPCLVLFDGNVPRFFAAHERGDFARFLDALPGPYLVAVQGGRVVACGGYAMNGDSGDGALCWGMVAPELHGEGLGKRLLVERLRRLAADPAVRRIVLETSQHTAGFFERLGFVVTEVDPDGFAPGIDRYVMRLDASRARAQFPPTPDSERPAPDSPLPTLRKDRP
jgi:ribosomal protein S18 acetylase RimI-like enzyme